MKALIRFYLEKSWQPLLGLLLMTILKIIGMLYFPILGETEGLILAFGGWYLYKWNADERKTEFTYFSATVSKNLKDIYIVKTLVPALIICVPVLIASWDDSLSAISFIAVIKAFLVSFALVGFSIIVTKPLKLFIILLAIYALANDFQDKDLVLSVILFILMSYLSLKMIFAERLSPKKLKLGTIVAILLAFFFSSKFDDLYWSTKNQKLTVMTHKVKTDHGKANFSVSFDDFGWDELPLEELKYAGVEADLKKRIELIQKFQNMEDGERKKLIKGLSKAEIIPSPDVIIAFEDAVFSRLKEGAELGTDKKCQGVCDKLGQYAGRYYHQSRSDEGEKRYLAMIEGQKDEARREYVINLAANAKIFRHIDSVTSKLDDTDNPLTGARVILNELSDGIKSLETLGDHDDITDEEINELVKKELELKTF